MKNATAHILLIDSNPTRRHLIALEFRAAGAHVLETTGQRDIVDALSAHDPEPWIVAINDGGSETLRASLQNMYPTVPVVVIGGRNQANIAGRINIERDPELAGRVHSLVTTRDMAA